MNLLTTALPELLAEEARRAWQNILESAGETLADRLTEELAEGPEALQLPRVLACSPFVADLLRRKPQLLLDLVVSGQLQQSLPGAEFRDELHRMLCRDGAELSPLLRQYRAWHMLRIVWRDFSRLADTLETVRDTSLLAEAAIAEALAITQAELESRYGVPIGRDSGEAQQLIVLAMGKLGAQELNVSSDIDLIFIYPEAGQTDSKEHPISNEEFFTKVGRAVIAALDEVTAEGFVFRVDMRLRPYGESGALVHNFTALEGYYQDQGRDWERYAMIKARPVTGSPQQAAELTALLRPFIYRRYVDFGAIESLRGMKRMINTEVRRRGLQDDVKLGHGGIREVEFIAQCFQLIRGGRDLGLQQRELLLVLDECVTLRCLPQSVVTELRTSYLFLRDSEHAIQGYQDKQSQDLPKAELPQAAMAEVMGYASWEDYKAALETHRQAVAGHFRELIADPEENAEVAEEALSLWGKDLSEQALSDLGYRRESEAYEALQALQQSPRMATLQIQGRDRLQQFMPQLLRACAEMVDPDLALQRILPLVTAVVRRSAYLVMLLENPPALVDLVTLCGASPWIADQIARTPALLDELLDRASLYSAPDKDLLRDELRQQVTRLGADDLEAQMDALRYFKASHVLRVAASELVGRLPLMQVSDKLTWIAEVILEEVLAVAWAGLTKKYGLPCRDHAGLGFAVFGYGKLGGVELGYGSDLDLVFIYDAAKGGATDGENSIDNAVFYTRLGQRIIQIIETQMAMGQLYEVDMRLRPSGDSGMLVNTIQSFSRYQQDAAWTWEHQALVRARFVAGDPDVASAVNALRREILSLPRDDASLAREVHAMRETMRKHLLSDERLEDGEFHLKQGVGGIVDIEFMVQYAVLTWSHRVPELARWSDNVRILEALGQEGLFEQQECEALTQAYLIYRSAAHQLSLQQQPGAAPAGSFVQERAAVRAKWQQLFAPYIDETTYQ
ncbi:MAG: bifunctional [glutamate--ammonia ligase]-adenylyl-L-tyrosine phosphorylase/[glutamate--ammonia-ligase] adenylyltransferase [Halioglobus sp.]|nr:bifunctional [glutamate--ammonia ligase]-adenylyl-L-tyrosine phosphorylase/[glutamate--ammonia-ligase] adenylyltransferase [Halioglobus sp.]